LGARAEVDLAPEIMDDDARVDAEEVERDFQKVRVATPSSRRSRRAHPRVSLVPAPKCGILPP